jgi:hypothetical protein
MKRVIAPWSKVVVLALAALGVTVGFGAGAASADSPHFLNNQTTLSIQSDGDLSLHFKEAGLGDATTQYNFSAQAEVTCTCVTRSGNCPNAANKATFATAVSATFNIDPKNGTVNKTLEIDAPGCPASAQPTCGGGQRFELSSIEYTSISFADVTNSLSLGGLPQSLSVTGFTCP